MKAFGTGSKNWERIVFVKFSLKNEDTFDVLKYLNEKLGVPEQAFNTIANKEDSSEMQLLLNNLEMGKSIKKVEDDYGDQLLAYPYQNVWIKEDLIYQMTLNSKTKKKY